MILEEIKTFILSTIDEILNNDGGKDNFDSNISLIGNENSLDSMNLVELCLKLEDKASEFGFEFDWTSENALSKSLSMFRSIDSLAEEFLKQHHQKK